MGELLLRKALACRDRVARLRAALPANPDEMLRDERLEAFVSFHLFLLVQDCIDLAAHLIAARGLGVPASHSASDIRAPGIYRAVLPRRPVRTGTGSTTCELHSCRVVSMRCRMAALVRAHALAAAIQDAVRPPTPAQVAFVAVESKFLEERQPQEPGLGRKLAERRATRARLHERAEAARRRVQVRLPAACERSGPRAAR